MNHKPKRLKSLYDLRHPGRRDRPAAEAMIRKWTTAEMVAFAKAADAQAAIDERAARTSARFAERITARFRAMIQYCADSHLFE